jgi:radical SAM protein with 4Fe4S-binding SPASM domain
MSLPVFLSALDTIRDKPDYFTVVLTGGEPLLRQDIAVCGREIRKRGFRWSMVTNGYLYDEHTHIQLLNAGMGALTISLDGLETTHNWLRNNDRSFEKATTAIRCAAGSSRLNFDVVTCVNQRNIEELPQLYAHLLALKVKSWRLFTITPIGRAIHHEDLFLTDRQMKAIFDFIVAKRKAKEMDVKFSCEGYTGQYELKIRDTFFFCRAGINIASVLSDGSISACPNIDRSFAQGNIYQDNLQDVWDSQYQVFRNRAWTKTGQCRNCKDYNDCQGNGFHNWHGNHENVLVCHQEKINSARRQVNK